MQNSVRFLTYYSRVGKLKLEWYWKTQGNVQQATNSGRDRCKNQNLPSVYRERS